MKRKRSLRRTPLSRYRSSVLGRWRKLRAKLGGYNLATRTRMGKRWRSRRWSTTPAPNPIGRHICRKSPTDPSYSRQWSGFSTAPHCAGRCPDCGERLHHEGGSHYCPHCDDFKPQPSNCNSTSRRRRARNASSHLFRHPKLGAFSYQTMLVQVLPDGRTIGNVTKYSRTTSKHQTEAGVRNCDIQLDKVPMGADDLAAIARARGLLTGNNPRRRGRR